jgi:hypothetical protein
MSVAEAGIVDLSRRASSHTHEDPQMRCDSVYVLTQNRIVCLVCRVEPRQPRRSRGVTVADGP